MGVARYVTWPRTVCSIQGRDIKGQSLKGDYGVEVDDYVVDEESMVVSKATGKPIKNKIYKKTKRQMYPKLAEMKMSDGFKANAAFFKLGFLNPGAVALGRKFEELLPVLWMHLVSMYVFCHSLPLTTARISNVLANQNTVFLLAAVTLTVWLPTTLLQKNAVIPTTIPQAANRGSTQSIASASAINLFISNSPLTIFQIKLPF